LDGTARVAAIDFFPRKGPSNAFFKNLEVYCSILWYFVVPLRQFMVKPNLTYSLEQSFEWNNAKSIIFYFSVVLDLNDISQHQVS